MGVIFILVRECALYVTMYTMLVSGSVLFIFNDGLENVYFQTWRFWIYLYQSGYQN